MRKRKVKIIQVFGLNSSGSTLLHLMLGGAVNAAACGEVYAFFRPWSKRHLNPDCSCGRQAAECFWKKVEYPKEKHFHTEFAHFQKVDTVIDESKDLNWVIDSQRWAQESGSEIYNIMSLKTPLAQMYSEWKRHRTITLFEKVGIPYYKRFLSTGIPFLTIDFGELTQNPILNLKRVYKLLDLEWRDDSHQFWKKEHCYLFGNPGLHKQLKSDNFSVKVQSEFPEEFLEAADPILNKLESSYEFKFIWEQLVDRSINSVEYIDGTPVPYKPVIHPIWYNKRVLIKAYRRVFPPRNR